MGAPAGMTGADLKPRGTPAKPQGTRRRATALVLLSLIAVSACGTGSAPSSGGEPGAELTEAGSSRFDEAGIEAMEEHRSVVLDLTSGSLAKADIGLPPDSIAPMVSVDEEEPLTVTLKMAGGDVVLETPTVKLFTTTARDTFRYITIFRIFDDPEDLVAEVEASVDAYGVDRGTVDLWRSGVDSGLYDNHDTNFQPGTKLGSGVQISVNWDRDEPRQVLEYTITPGVPDGDR